MVALPLAPFEVIEDQEGEVGLNDKEDEEDLQVEFVEKGRGILLLRLHFEVVSVLVVGDEGHKKQQ